MVYSEVKELKVGKGVLECAVCLTKFEELHLFPHCSHIFHLDYVDAWFTSHVTCFVCYANLIEQVIDDNPDLLHIATPNANTMGLRPKTIALP
ncbi:E3 ubiquitin-protein ligase [Musa troglodytarum]|uniref:RING-type E3 ubiquitin transferase n=1 Tax=Musa troglodytarum TaxID=320322 RepID=A0A9E7EPJ1_9LILI|nr:E3 ubiquitin-protein ligase [Musa troglodytarum]